MTLCRIPTYNLAGWPLQPLQLSNNDQIQNILQMAINEQIQDYDSAVFLAQDYIQTDVHAISELTSIKCIVLLKQDEKFPQQLDQKVRFYIRKADKIGALLALSTFCSIQDLRLQVLTNFGIPAESQQLFYAGLRLDNLDLTLRRYNVLNGRIIHVVDKRNIPIDDDEVFTINLTRNGDTLNSYQIKIKGRDRIRILAEKAASLFQIPRRLVVLSYCSRILDDENNTVFENLIETDSEMKVFDDRQAILEPVQKSPNNKKSHEQPRESNKTEQHSHGSEQKVQNLTSSSLDILNSSRVSGLEPGQPSSLLIRRADSVVFSQQAEISILNSVRFELSYEESFIKPESSLQDGGFVAVHATPEDSYCQKIYEQGCSLDVPARHKFQKKPKQVLVVSESQGERIMSTDNLEVSPSAMIHKSNQKIARSPLIRLKSRQETDTIPGSKQFNIIVRDFDDKTLTVSVHNSSSILDIKHKLEKQNPEMQANRLEMMLEGKTLHDNDVVADLGASEGSVFLLID